LVLRATTDKRLALETGGLYALELRGIDTDSDNASFDKPEFLEQRCVAQPCEWTVVPAKAANYDFKAFLIDLRGNKAAGESNAVKRDGTAPPGPQATGLSVNGKAPPKTPMGADDYSDFPAGPMSVEAKWKTDAGPTGYYVKISTDDKVYARCFTGTSCRVPVK